MWREANSSYLLTVLVFIVICKVVISDPYANITDITSSEKSSRKVHHRRHRHKKPPILITETPLQDDDIMISRIPKLFSFQALDEDLMIDMEFSVPFIHVPVKKSMQKSQQAFKSLVNLNTPALLLSGIFVAVGAGIGLIFNSFVGTPIGGLRRNSRITDVSNMLDPLKLVNRNSDGEKSETAFGDIVQSIEEKFKNNDVDITSCIQKSICFLVQKSAERVRNGVGNGNNKIVDGLATSDWVLHYLEGTAVRDAIDSGTGSTHCGYKYPTCKWANPEKHMINLVLGMVKNFPGFKDNF